MNFLVRSMDKHATTRHKNQLNNLFYRIFTSTATTTTICHRGLHLNRDDNVGSTANVERMKVQSFGISSRPSLCPTPTPTPTPSAAAPLPFCSHFKSVFVHLHNWRKWIAATGWTEERKREEGRMTLTYNRSNRQNKNRMFVQRTITEWKNGLTMSPN